LLKIDKLESVDVFIPNQTLAPAHERVVLHIGLWCYSLDLNPQVTGRRLETLASSNQPLLSFPNMFHRKMGSGSKKQLANAAMNFSLGDSDYRVPS
jgi:hypothetical protein